MTNDLLICGKYILMPQASTYARGVEALHSVSVKRPFTFKENLQARVEAYESGDYSLFDTWLNSCTGIAYKDDSTEFKLIPACAELIDIDKDRVYFSLPIDYSRITGVELDSSKGKYNQGLTNAEILKHPAWLALVEGDRALLRTYTDIVFSAYVAKYGSRDKLMAFYVRGKVWTDELRGVFAHNLRFKADVSGDANFSKCSLFLHR